MKMGLEELKTYHVERLNNVLQYSRRNIPYYQNKLRSYPNGNIINNIRDLEKIPTLEKNTVRLNFEEMHSNCVHRISRRYTSGSSGQPMMLFKDRHATAMMDAVMYHAYSWHNIKIGDKQARFWGMPITQINQYKEIIKDKIMNRKRFSAFDINDETMWEYYHKIMRFKPRYCYGYPSLMYEYANFLKKYNLTLKPLKLKAVIVTGELVRSNDLDVIEQTFGAHVVNEYGCTEVGIIAFQCRNRKMHVMSPNIVLEVIKDGKQVFGEEGDVYITELFAREMPLIRYRIGDRAILSDKQCSCGCTFPVIELLSGRVDSYIITPDGHKIYDAILAYTLKQGIISFQAVQRKLNMIDVYIVRDKDYTKDIEKKYHNMLSNKIGRNVIIKFYYVDTIKRDNSGKIRYFKSEL